MDKSYIVLIVIVVLMVAMMGFSMFGNKKKKKKAEEMMNSITKGVKLKTIGGFVGVVVAIDDKEGVMILNLGDEQNPINVTIDKAAVYTVLTPVKPVTVETEDGTKVVEVEDEGAKSLDDLEADAIAKERAERRAAKKRGKKAADVLAIEEPAADEVSLGEDVKIDGEVSNTSADDEVKN